MKVLFAIIEDILISIVILLAVAVISVFLVLLYCKYQKSSKNKNIILYSLNRINSDSLVVDYKIRMARERISNHSYVHKDEGEELDIFDKLNCGIDLVNDYTQSNNYDIDNICRRIY